MEDRLTRRERMLNNWTPEKRLQKMAMERFRKEAQGKLPNDPDEEEIKAKCAEIREGWSEEEHRRRSKHYAESENIMMLPVTVSIETRGAPTVIPNYTKDYISYR